MIGAIAQLGERVLCKHDVVGSIPSGSTIASAWGARKSEEEMISASLARLEVLIRKDKGLRRIAVPEEGRGSFAGCLTL